MTGLQISLIALSLTIGLAALFAAIVGLEKYTRGSRVTQGRIKRLVGENRVPGQNEKKKKAKKAQKNSEPNFKRKSAIDKLGETIFNELLAADIMMRWEEFAIIWIVCATVPSALVALFISNIPLAVVCALAGAILPVMLVKNKQTKRTKAFESQLGDALIICCNCLRSGLSFQQSMETIAQEMPAPLGVEFSRALAEINYGHSMDSALNSMAERIKSPDLTMAVAAVNVQRQTGGNLSEILETISETIRERIKIKKEINSITAQGRMSGTIIGVLPIAVGGFLCVINPSYMSMFVTTTPGKIMMAVAIVMEIVGFILVKKIVTVKY